MHAEKIIANSVATVVLLTENSLRMKEVLFALRAAMFHYGEHSSRVILVRTRSMCNHQVHAAESCPFPVPPKSVQSCFDEKAVTWLQCTLFFFEVSICAGYAEEGVAQVAQKYREEKKAFFNSLHQQEVAENITTRVFLRYKKEEQPTLPQSCQKLARLW